MTAIDKQWRSSRLELSFPGLGPNTVHGLIPKGSMVKTGTKVDGLFKASQDRRPRCSEILLRRRPSQEGKGELASSRTEWDSPQYGIEGFFGVIFYICLCFGLNLFILQVIAHPIKSSACRELLVCPVSWGLVWGLGGAFVFPSLQFSKRFREAVAALGGGMKNYKTACVFLFSSLFGGTTSLFCHAATVCLCS